MADPTTLADLLRGGYKPPTESALGDPIVQHFKDLPANLEKNQRAMDKTMAGMYKTDFLGKPNPNYYPEAMGEFTQDYATNVLGTTKVVKDVAKKLSPYVKNVLAGDEMILHHNISPEKLYKVDKVGGMPVPSLAISKASDPMNNFGDITLIGTKQMATPSRNNPVFRSDAYTKNAPEISYQFDPKSEKNLRAMFNDISPNMLRSEQRISTLMDKLDRAHENELVQAKFLKEKGLLPDIDGVEKAVEYDQAIREAVKNNRNEFDDWLGNFHASLPQQGVNVKERIFKGYTDAGNRKYADANLNNLVKEMKGGANSEGYDYGAPSFRAASVPKFKNMAEILRSRDKLISKEAFEPIAKQNNDAYYGLYDEVGKLGSYRAGDALLEAGERNNPNVLDRIYGEVPQDLKGRVGNYISGLKDMPTEYFEAKPQRAVQLNEFAGALVPHDIPPRAMQILEQSGLGQIYKYASPEEKKSLMDKFGGQMFAGVPMVGVTQTDEFEDRMKALQARKDELLKK